jgi:hypothetical protein
MAQSPSADLGFRVGFADPNNGSTAFLLGADYRLRMLNHTEDFPLDGALILGAGASLVEGNNVFRIPIGFTLGRKILLDNSSTVFVPYFTPTAVPYFSDDSDLKFAVGLGVDMQFGKKFALNVSGSFGDIDGISISFSWLH